MFTLLIRSVVIYLLVFCIVRLMGKRQISDMQPFDLVITLLIADLASAPISDGTIPLFYGVIPILALFILHRSVAFLALKSQGMRRLVCGNPILVIEKGSVVEEALHAANYTLNDLMEQLRLKDVFSLTEVEYAILETNGSLSVLKANASSPSPTAPSELLVADGKANEEAIATAGYSPEAFGAALRRAGISDPRSCLFVCAESDGSLFVQQKSMAGKKANARTITPKEARK